MKTYLSPDGSEILGTLETLIGRAEIIGINDDGTPEYQGGTEVFWNAQKTVRRDGQIVYLDEAGREWTFDELVPADMEEDEQA
ncbi:MAG: hypothetical protein M9895_04365 [Aquamicrobium sp.]|uniref:hypothetical protein n=1 Tax=Aquamicrobium sp. TaxID=1872579 RepID=UPI00349EC02A|nr:hypothetical protein [Aquamicrobium sp.]MCO5157945.1 hypothetical protein [Aquamicrobium sp.]